MALTDFGKAIRKARIDTNETLGSMADSLNVSPAFLSGVETGRKKIPISLIANIQQYFSAKGTEINRLAEMADVANQSVSLEGLSPQQQMLIAGFARSSMDAATLEKMALLLAATEKNKNK